MSYVFVGTHSESLESGRQLVFGDTVSEIDPAGADKRLLDEGLLITSASTPTPPQPPAITSSATQSNSSSEEAA